MKRKKSKKSYLSWIGFQLLGKPILSVHSKDETLPRSYLTGGCQANLDAKWEIKKTPGEHPGAEMPFKELLQQEIEERVSKNTYCTHIFNMLIWSAVLPTFEDT